MDLKNDISLINKNMKLKIINFRVVDSFPIAAYDLLCFTPSLAYYKILYGQWEFNKHLDP